MTEVAVSVPDARAPSALTRLATQTSRNDGVASAESVKVVVEVTSTVRMTRRLPPTSVKVPVAPELPQVPAVESPFTEATRLGVTPCWPAETRAAGVAPAATADAPSMTTTVTGTILPRCNFFSLLNICGLLLGARQSTLASFNCRHGGGTVERNLRNRNSWLSVLRVS